MALMKTIGGIETDNNIDLDDESIVLWTNSAPTTAISSPTDITLSDDVDNYTLIAVKYIYSTTRTEFVFKSYFSPAEILASDRSATGTMRQTMAIDVITTSDNVMTRYLLGYSTNKNKMRIGSCYQHTAATAYDTYCIPTYIYGIK